MDGCNPLIVIGLERFSASVHYRSLESPLDTTNRSDLALPHLPPSIYDLIHAFSSLGDNRSLISERRYSGGEAELGFDAIVVDRVGVISTCRSLGGGVHEDSVQGIPGSLHITVIEGSDDHAAKSGEVSFPFRFGKEGSWLSAVRLPATRARGHGIGGILRSGDVVCKRRKGISRLGDRTTTARLGKLGKDDSRIPRLNQTTRSSCSMSAACGPTVR